MDKLGKICILQWMSEHTGIPTNVVADRLFKEARNFNDENNSQMNLDDAMILKSLA